VVDTVIFGFVLAIFNGGIFGFIDSISRPVREMCIDRIGGSGKAVMVTDRGVYAIVGAIDILQGLYTLADEKADTQRTSGESCEIRFDHRGVRIARWLGITLHIKVNWRGAGTEGRTNDRNGGV
jgi:hypothetical protein